MQYLKPIDKVRIGIVGGGYVGSATALLESSLTEVVVYDLDPSKCRPQGFEFSQLRHCNIVFVCVPTPMKHNGQCHTDIVESVVKDLQDLEDAPYIVVRSTVPVGFCKKHGVNFMPEFLTEKNWRQDFFENKDWIVGSSDLKDKNFPQVMKQILKASHKEGKIKNSPSIHSSDTSTAELCKLARNCFLATKVSFFNEMSKFSEAVGVNYESARELIVLDERVGESHTKVPGPDGKGGFGGTCFPKDMNSAQHQMNSNSSVPILIEAAIRRNNTVDRTDLDWLQDKGRAVV